MVEIVKGIHHFEIPTPFPVGSVNSYLIEGDPLTMIDVGPQYPPALSTMSDALASLGYEMSDVEQILLTHGHIDHSGMARAFVDARTERGLDETRVYIHGTDLNRVAYHEEYIVDRMKSYAKIMRDCGSPPEILEAIKVDRLGEFFGSLARSVPSIQTLSNGELIESGIGLLLVVWTPGHTKGCVCFVSDAKRVIFTGDHVLGDISSNPSLDFEGTDISMLTYIESLDRILKFGDYQVLPGHRMNVDNLAKRVAELKADIYDKLARLESILTTEPTTVYELSRQLYGEYDPTQLVLALAETLDLARILEEEGKAKISDSPHGKVVSSCS